MVDSLEEKGQQEPGSHIAGRLMGMIVFMAGIILLVMTFVMAYQAFRDPDILLPLRDIQKTPPIFFYARAAVLLFLLLVMGYVASLISARGAQLFFTARKEVRHGTPHD